jgi:VanZ family protein
VAMGEYGMAYVDDLSGVSSFRPLDALTIELAVAADHTDGRKFGSLLMLHDGSDQRQVFVGQWKSSLVVMNGNDYDHSQNLPRITATNAFTPKTPRLIVITAANGQTRLYIDGRLAGTNAKWQLDVPRSGEKLRLVMGNSVTGKNSWSGQFYGLALYAAAFSEEAVARHYTRWRASARFPYERADALAAVYTFDAIRNRTIADRSGRHQPLLVPEKPMVLEKTLLSAPWREAKLDRYLLADAAINFIGFIPLGISLIGLLNAAGRTPGRAGILALMGGCCLLSLGIEILQAWMPMRSSSMLDFILNTLGAWLGVWLFGVIINLRRRGTVY